MIPKSTPGLLNYVRLGEHGGRISAEQELCKSFLMVSPPQEFWTLRAVGGGYSLNGLGTEQNS